MTMLNRILISALLAALSFGAAAQKVSDLTAASALGGTELFPCVQTTTKKCTAAQIKTFTSASPTLVTPNLGTPSAGVATNLTGTASGLTAGTVTTNANLTGDVTSSGNATTLATVNGNVGSFTNSSITVNGKGLVTAASSGAAGAVLTANLFTDTQTITKSIAATSTDGAVLQNTTAAAAGAQQWSPRLRLTGQGWKTNATAASQQVDFWAEVQPVQGAAAPSASLVFSSRINGGGTTTAGMTFNSYTGILALNDTQYGGSAGFYSAINAGPVQLGWVATAVVDLRPSRLQIPSTYNFAWSDSSTVGGTSDLLLTRAAAATLQQGAANAATPVAQTLQAQGSRSGTDTNVGGANYTIRCGAGTGTGTPCSTILQSYVAVASGTGAQTATDTLTLNNGTATFASSVYSTANANATVIFQARNDSAGATAQAGHYAHNGTAVGGFVMEGTGFTTSGLVVANQLRFFNTVGGTLYQNSAAADFIWTRGGTAATNEVARLGAGTLSLGVAGTTVGSLALNNATSGSISISPIAGALGTVTITAPALTGTMLVGSAVNSVSPTSPNRTITIVHGGTTYYIAAKTTND